MSAKLSGKIKNEKRPGKKTRRAAERGLARTYGKNNKSPGGALLLILPPTTPPVTPLIPCHRIAPSALASQIYLGISVSSAKALSAGGGLN